MPIVIRELLASDTVSNAVDKINFNFDQLLLNGGGAVGPPGPLGPVGPVGGRGLKGSVWHKDNTVQPGTEPNSIVIPNLLKDDYYLQSNGQVWTYTGSTWSPSLINLKGPQGAVGSSIGFNYAGGYPGGGSINNQNIAYPVPMPGGITSGANQQSNQGVSTLMVGAIASNTISPPGITYDSSFQISDAMSKQIDSSLVSMLIHQKNSGSSAIRFMGGGEELSDNYEQLSLDNLSNISLGVDDALNINIPKESTSPNSASDIIGFNVNTFKRGQQYSAGKQIVFISGTDSVPSLPTEISDITFTLGSSNSALPAKFSVATINQATDAIFEIGGRIEIPSVSTKSGKALLDAGEIGIVGKTSVSIKRSTSQFINMSPSHISIHSDTPININTTNNQPINITSAGAINAGSVDSISLSAPQINNTGNVLITGTLSVNDSGTFNGSVKMNTVNTGSGDILVRNSTTNIVEKMSNVTVIPLGGIIMWSGSLLEIPGGWALCDGSVINSKQTPDLRGRFVVGYDPAEFEYNSIGNMGGSSEITLTVDQLPSHTHNIPNNLIPLRRSIDTGGKGSHDDQWQNYNNNKAVEYTGGNQPHENRPPYYVMAFIMYVGN